MTAVIFVIGWTALSIPAGIFIGKWIESRGGVA